MKTKKTGLRVILAIVLSVVLIGSTAAVAYAARPAKGITLYHSTPCTGAGTFNITASASWSKVNAYKILFVWEKFTGGVGWEEITSGGQNWGYRLSSGTRNAPTLQNQIAGTYRLKCQLYDRKGNPIPQRRGGYQDIAFNTGPICT